MNQILETLTVSDYNRLLQERVQVWKFYCQAIQTVYIGAKNIELAIDKFIQKYPEQILFYFNYDGDDEKTIDQYDKNGCMICGKKECDIHGLVKNLTKENYEKLFNICRDGGNISLSQITIDFE